MIRTINRITIILLSLLLLFPVIWMITGSFKSVLGAVAMPPTLIPRKPTLENYAILLEYPVFRWAVNSFIVSGFGAFGATVFSILSGYAFAKKKIPYKEIIFVMLLASIMVPMQSKMIPLFLMIKTMGLVDTLPGMIIPGLTSPVYIFFFRQFLKSFPDDLLDSAEIDGAGEFTKIIHVVVPLSMAPAAAMFIIGFIGGWNALMWQLIIARSEEIYTLPVGIIKLIQSFDIFYLSGIEHYGLKNACATFAFAPPLIVFIIFQKHFMKNIFSGATKE